MLIDNSYRQIGHQDNQTADFHLHAHLNKGSRYIVFTDSDDWSWDDFLSNGVARSKIFRFLEFMIDENGMEKVVADRVRS